MTLETFLIFWSAHNTQIIEVLIGLILLMVVYLAFRSFFGEEGSAFAEGAAASPALDAAQLEKTLQKILDTQATTASATVVPDAATVAEVERLKGEVAQRDATIEELRKTMSSTATLGAVGPSDEEKKKNDEKIRDLEGRLAEYEIISEDIADLSFFKEENSKLQKEIEALRAATPATSAAVDPLPAEVISELVEATSSPAPLPDAVLETPAAILPEIPASDAPAAAASALPADAPKANADSIAETLATTADAATDEKAPTAEESQLMNQFENFVKKG